MNRESVRAALHATLNAALDVAEAELEFEQCGSAVGGLGQSVMSARLVAKVGTGSPSSSCAHWAGRRS